MLNRETLLSKIKIKVILLYFALITVSCFSKEHIPDSKAIWGYMDKEGNMAIDFRFSDEDDTGNFSDGLTKIKINGKYGFIDKTGKIAIEPQFVRAEDFSEGLAVVSVKNKYDKYECEKYGYIDKTGKFVIKPEFYRARSFSDGMAVIHDVGFGYYDPCGYIDKTGRIVLKPVWWEDAEDFINGIAYVHWHEERIYTGACIDKTGHVINDPNVYYEGFYPEGLELVRKGDKIGYHTVRGECVIEAQFDDAMYFFEELAGVKINQKWGYIDKTGKIVIKPQFDDVKGFSEGIAAVEVDRKWGYINKSGHMIRKPEFKEAWFFHDGLAKVKKYI